MFPEFLICAGCLKKTAFRSSSSPTNPESAEAYTQSEAFNNLMDWMVTQFKDQGISISKFYFCPHHPTEGKGKFKKECECRKPKPGMILKAQKELGINLSASMVIGDKPSDIRAGINAGIQQNFLIPTDSHHPLHLPNCTHFPNLEALMTHLKKRG